MIIIIASSQTFYVDYWMTMISINPILFLFLFCTGSSLLFSLLPRIFSFPVLVRFRLCSLSFFFCFFFVLRLRERTKSFVYLRNSLLFIQRTFFEATGLQLRREDTSYAFLACQFSFMVQKTKDAFSTISLRVFMQIDIFHNEEAELVPKSKFLKCINDRD